MRTFRISLLLLSFSVVSMFASGCWKVSIPVGGDSGSGAFTCERTTADHPSDVYVIDLQYVGTWNWLESCGGFAYMCSTPESAGYNERLHLSARGSYTLCRDDSSVEEGRYMNEQRGERELIHFVNRDLDTLRSLFIHQISADTLVLDEGCCDQFAHVYARD